MVSCDPLAFGGRRMAAWGLFDGLGGHPLGRIAAQTAAQTMAAALRSSTVPTEVLYRLDAAVRGTGGASTALVAAIGRNARGWAVSIGDTAAFILNEEDRVEPLTPLDSLGNRHVTACLGGTLREPHFASFELAGGSSLLLCTDGVHSVVHSRDLENALRSPSVHKAVAHLLGRVEERGRPDDATAILIRAR